MLLTNFYNQNPKATTKIIIQVLSILIIADIIWIILFSSAWEHGENSEENSSKEDIIFWDSLWFIHKSVYVLAYIELLLKVFLLYYLMVDFKEKYKLRDLFNFNYDDGRSGMNPQNLNLDEQQYNFDNNADNIGMNDLANQSNNSYQENFENRY